MLLKKAQDLVEQSSPLYIMDNGVKRVVLGVHTKINSGLIFDDDYYYIDVATKIVGEDYFQTKATIRIAVDKKLIDAIHDTKKYKAKFVYRLSAICSQELEIVDIGERVLSKI